MSSTSKDEIGKPAENHKQPEDLTQKEMQCRKVIVEEHYC